MSNSHYFDDNSKLKSEILKLSFYLDDEKFEFKTDHGVFSRTRLDQGTIVLIKSTYKKDLGSDVLDLGCGYGPVGIVMKRFHPEINLQLIDINDRAVALTVENLKLNRVQGKAYKEEDMLNIVEDFDTILFNPPIKSGKANIYSLYEKSFQKLKDNGRLYVVISKRHGALSSFNKLKELFREVSFIDHDKGYQIIEAIK
ncbi:MAG: class I SAM-dependent methyltransferase [Erysipelotrichaceae bacterium]|nr:class I SAM-dependent methyltransferase [Erysipelotrichaceae bacterium]